MRYHEINEDNHQFTAWFRGSKVVDATGQPKRMYHGTGAGDISSFDPTRANAEALYGPGFYFTDNTNVAGGTGGGQTDSDIYTKADFQLAGYAWQGRQFGIATPLSKKQMAYAKRLFASRHVENECHEDIGMREGWRTAYRAFNGGEESFRQYLMSRDANPWLLQKLKVFRELTTRPTVFPVYLRIVNPFDMDAHVAFDLLRTLWDAVPEHFESFENASGGWRNSATAMTGANAWEWLVKRVIGGDKAKANQILANLGYDGIHHTGGFNIGTMGKHDVWVAFRATQIKSVFSRGFNPHDDRISEASRLDRQ